MGNSDNKSAAFGLMVILGGAVVGVALSYLSATGMLGPGYSHTGGMFVVTGSALGTYIVGCSPEWERVEQRVTQRIGSSF